MTDETKNVMMYRFWPEHFHKTSLPNTTHPPGPVEKMDPQISGFPRTIGRPRRSIHHPETAKADLRFFGVTPAFRGRKPCLVSKTSLHVPKKSLGPS